MLLQNLDAVIERRINPEIYVDADALESISSESIERAAERLLENGIRVTLHSAYMDLNPGARDEEIRKTSVRRVIHSIKLSLPFKPLMVVCHPGYFDYNYSFNYKVWVERAYRSFSEIGEECSKHGLKVAIENVFERNPDNLYELLLKLPENTFGFCFDPGHANLFTEVPMIEWLNALGMRLFEIHIHDNNGKYDEHLPLGDGRIPYDEIFQAINKKNPVFTLEPHRVEHLRRSIDAFLAKVRKT